MGMTAAPVRIAMWSGPRNISTAMMRSFGNRPDCAVSDEPFYAAYLAATGLIHPQTEDILAAQPRDAADVVAGVTGPVPGARALWYQKHMTHHMLPGFDRGWIDGVANAFLIRAPEAVLLSYVEKRSEVTLDDIGLPQQVELFDRVADRLGRAPPVIESRDVLSDPPFTLAALCDGLGIAFD
ncbi:MAG: HAD family hydrolase, partial [Janthinobacterium lividum]